VIYVGCNLRHASIPYQHVSLSSWLYLVLNFLCTKHFARLQAAITDIQVTLQCPMAMIMGIHMTMVS
jgi:hypothetical protein